MKIRLFIFTQIFLWGLLLPNPSPKYQKLINYLKQINESLMKVVGSLPGTYKQTVHLERAKALVQEAIDVEHINDNATLYAIGGILFNDPVYAARAVELEKNKHPLRSTTVQLVRREVKAEDEAEVYRQTLEDQIQEEESYLLFVEFMNPEEKHTHELRLRNLKKTRDWAEAQSLAHGMLKNALYMYQNEKSKEGQP